MKSTWKEDTDMITRSGLLLATLGLLVALPVAGQRGDRRGDRAEMRPPRSGGLTQQVESALRHRDRLELTDGQVAQLEGLLEDLDTALRPIREEASALRAASVPADLDRDAMREHRRESARQRRALGARADTVTAPLQQRYEQVVSPLQRRDLERTARQRGGRWHASVRGQRGQGVAPRGGSRRPSPAYRGQRSRSPRAWRSEVGGPRLPARGRLA